MGESWFGLGVWLGYWWGSVVGSVLFFFFFQAEDGIRDFCLSRGLGDVYKRQVVNIGAAKEILTTVANGNSLNAINIATSAINPDAVSYTHLTLPTKRIV